jgi:hypothetical protein
MKVLAILCVFLGVASALPLLKPAISNGVFLETEARTPTFAKGIRTDCNYDDVEDRDLGNVFAQGDATKYIPKSNSAEDIEDSLKEAKTACDDMGPDCGGVVRNPQNEFQLFHGSSLKIATGSMTYLKEICAFPLPYSNFWKGENEHDSEAKDYDDSHEPDPNAATTAQQTTGTEPKGDGAPKRNMGNGKVYKFNHSTNPNVERMRWKLSNGPSYSRIDDGKDHGAKSRLMDGKSEELDIEGCMKACSKRTDCMSGHYCESGEGAISGKCFLSGDWDPYGIEPEYDGCNVYRNFRQNHEWVKPVLRTESGEYVKQQWHSKTPIDVAYAQQAQGYDTE